MQLANAIIPAAWLAPGAVEPELVAPPAVAMLDPVVVADPLAALDAEEVELGELPPHPATMIPLTSAATASRRARGERVSRFG